MSEFFEMNKVLALILCLFVMLEITACFSGTFNGSASDKKQEVHQSDDIRQ